MPQNLLKELGRSMTEMLGVLALVGVLSIVAIFGYSYAMNKYRSNVIFNDVKMLVTFAVSSDFTRKSENTTTTPDGLGVDVSAPNPYVIGRETQDTFYITAKNVTEGVCQVLVKERPDYLEEITANPMGAGVCEKKDTNEVYFYVNGELTTTPDGEETEKCNTTTPCSGACSECMVGRCIDQDSKCPKGQSCMKGQCRKCPTGQIQGVDGTCYECDNIPSSTRVEWPDECRKCSGRTVVSGNHCYACVAMYWLMTTEEDCNRCRNISGQLFFGSDSKNGACGFCFVDVNADATKKQCEQCKNRYFIGNNDAKGECRICKGIVSADGRSCTPA